jgi:hypothetical protein
VTQPVGAFAGVTGAAQNVAALFGSPTQQATNYGIIPPDAPISVNDLFASLLELRWKSISLPCGSIKTRLRQDLVIHKFVDRDGAHIEGTGRAPLEITARVPMLNGLAKGPNEQWQSILYPYVRDNLLQACADKSSGTLQHPEIGALTCKCQTMEWDLDAAIRSGVWVELSWIETDDTGVDLDNDLSIPSPAAGIQAAGKALDGQLAALPKGLFPQGLALPSVTFSNLVFAIRGVVDQTTLLQKKYAGQIDNALYNVQSLEDSVNRAGNSNALNWPIIQSCERMKAALYDQKAAQLAKARAQGLFTVAKDMTLAALAGAIPTDLGSLLTLNPRLAQTPLVPAGTIARFYLN